MSKESLIAKALVMNAGDPFMAVTCEISGALVGIDSAHVEEIVRLVPITPVHGAPAWVLGIVNLRGRIVTVLDLAQKMGHGITGISEDTRIVIVRAGGESVGLLVPKLADVVEVDPRLVKVVAGDSRGAHALYLGLFEHDGQLLGVLDLAKTVQAS